MPEKNVKEPKEPKEAFRELTTDELEAGINPESIKKSLEVGIIYPALKTKLDTPYTVKIASENYITYKSQYSEKTKALLVDYDGIIMNLTTPKSFIQSITVERIRKGLDMKDLKGKTITFMKQIGSTKQYDNAKLYSVQIHD